MCLFGLSADDGDEKRNNAKPTITRSGTNGAGGRTDGTKDRGSGNTEPNRAETAAVVMVSMC